MMGLRKHIYRLQIYKLKKSRFAEEFDISRHRYWIARNIEEFKIFLLFKFLKKCHHFFVNAFPRRIDDDKLEFFKFFLDMWKLVNYFFGRSGSKSTAIFEFVDFGVFSGIFDSCFDNFHTNKLFPNSHTQKAESNCTSSTVEIQNMSLNFSYQLTRTTKK